MIAGASDVQDRCSSEVRHVPKQPTASHNIQQNWRTQSNRTKTMKNSDRDAIWGNRDVIWCNRNAIWCNCDAIWCNRDAIWWHRAAIWCNRDAIWCNRDAIWCNRDAIWCNTNWYCHLSNRGKMMPRAYKKCSSYISRSSFKISTL